MKKSISFQFSDLLENRIMIRQCLISNAIEMANKNIVPSGFFGINREVYIDSIVSGVGEFKRYCATINDGGIFIQLPT